jgi:hypothetical protein
MGSAVARSPEVLEADVYVANMLMKCALKNGQLATGGSRL